MLPDNASGGRSDAVGPTGGAEYNAAYGWRRHTPGGRVQEIGGAAGWPVLHAADGLSQRSLLMLLDFRRTP
jgi:hypothetical protein